MKDNANVGNGLAAQFDIPLPPYHALPFPDSIAEGVLHIFFLTFMWHYLTYRRDTFVARGITPQVRMRGGRGIASNLLSLRHPKPHRAGNGDTLRELGSYILRDTPKP